MNHIIHDFTFTSDTVAAKHITIKEYKNSNSFIIEFTYQNLGNIRTDIISYKIIQDGSMGSKSIKDFIGEINGNFFLKPELKDYTFFNNTALESVLKPKNQ